MAVPYIFITQKSLPDKDGVQKEISYARTVANHRADTEELAQNISKRCTVNPADVAAVLYALGDELKTRLKNGEIVELNGIGSFRLIAGTGVIQAPHKVRTSGFIRRRINFHPDKSLKTTLNNLSFIRK